MLKLNFRMFAQRQKSAEKSSDNSATYSFFLNFEFLFHSDFLIRGIAGTNNYICGENVTEVDCFAFGILCQIRYQTPDDCPGKQLLNEDSKSFFLRLFSFNTLTSNVSLKLFSGGIYQDQPAQMCSLIFDLHHPLNEILI